MTIVLLQEVRTGNKFLKLDALGFEFQINSTRCQFIGCNRGVALQNLRRFDEALASYDQAFECHRQANQIGNTKVDYDGDSVSKMTGNVIAVFNQEFLAQSFAFASDTQSPLFIVGMPRSGATLMANILSNHRSIATAGELPTMGDHVALLPKLTEGGIPYPQAVKHITPLIAARLIND